MKKFFVILFAGVLLSTGVAYAATTSQEALLAQMISMLKSIGDSLAALVTNTSVDKAGSTSSGSVEIAPSVGSATELSPTKTPTPTPLPVPKPTPVAGSPFQVTNPNGASDVAWKIGETYSIEWQTIPSMGITAQTDYVDVLLLTDVSKTAIWKIDAAVKNAGKIKWTIPSANIYPGTYRIGVQAFANPATRAVSEPFTIVAKDVVSASSKGETAQGDSGLANCRWIWMGYPPASGWQWVCFKQGGGTNSIIGGSGNSNIQNPSSWSLNAPVKGDEWRIGTSQYIKWNSPTSYKYVTIKLVGVSSGKEIVISTMTLNSQKQKLWKVTGAEGVYQIKVYPYGSPEKAVTSGEILLRKAVQGDSMLACKITACANGCKCYRSEYGQEACWGCPGSGGGTN